MEKKITIEELVEIVKDQFETSEKMQIDENVNFKALKEFDSLTGMCIIVALKDNYGIDVDEATFIEFKTVKDIHTFIETR